MRHLAGPLVGYLCLMAAVSIGAPLAAGAAGRAAGFAAVHVVPRVGVAKPAVAAGAPRPGPRAAVDPAIRFDRFRPDADRIGRRRFGEGRRRHLLGYLQVAYPGDADQSYAGQAPPAETPADFGERYFVPRSYFFPPPVYNPGPRIIQVGATRPDKRRGRLPRVIYGIPPESGTN